MKQKPNTTKSTLPMSTWNSASTKQISAIKAKMTTASSPTPRVVLLPWPAGGG
jgi:hypothetical protein